MLDVGWECRRCGAICIIFCWSWAYTLSTTKAASIIILTTSHCTISQSSTLSSIWPATSWSFDNACTISHNGNVFEGRSPWRVHCVQKYVLTLFLNCLQTQGNVGKWKKKEGDMVRDIVHSSWCFNFTIVKLVLCIKYLVSAANSKFLQRVLF